MRHHSFSALCRILAASLALDGIVLWLKSVLPMMPNHHLTQDEVFALAAYIMSLRMER
jgi:hypothetical protein